MPALQPAKLKPCPACSSKRLRVFVWDDETKYGECLRPGCRMSGPLRATNEAATEAWNSLPRRDLTHNALGEGRERGILREASSAEGATSTDGLEPGGNNGDRT